MGWPAGDAIDGAGRGWRHLRERHVGGIVKSTSGGDAWHATGLNIRADAHQVIAHPVTGGLLAAAISGGMAVSDDGGDSWRVHAEGLHARYARAVAVAGETVLISASDGPRGGHAALYRRPLAGDEPFEKCVHGLPDWFETNIDTYTLDARDDLVVSEPIGARCTPPTMRAPRGARSHAACQESRRSCSPRPEAARGALATASAAALDAHGQRCAVGPYRHVAGQVGSKDRDAALEQAVDHSLARVTEGVVAAGRDNRDGRPDRIEEIARRRCGGAVMANLEHVGGQVEPPHQ